MFCLTEPSSPVNFNSFEKFNGQAAAKKTSAAVTATKNTSAPDADEFEKKLSVMKNGFNAKESAEKVSESSKFCTDNSSNSDLKDLMISTQKKLISFYEEEWHGHLPPMILVTIQLIFHSL